MSDSKSCASCKFVFVTEMRSNYGDGPPIMECRRHAPQVVTFTQSGEEPNGRYPYDGDKYHTVTRTSEATCFPRVTADVSCGEFE